MNGPLAEYAGFAALWKRFAPETPFGRAARAAAGVLTDRAALEERWDLTDEALRLLDALEGDRVRLDRIRHHLRRIPRFPESPREAFDEVELFQLKKLLANHRRLLALLPDGAKARFGLAPLPEELHALLGTGREGDESFHVADAYDPELASVRGEIRRSDAEAAALRASRDEALQARCGFALGDRPFLLVPREALGEPAGVSDLLEIEAWDATRLCVRPRPSVAELRLGEEKAALLARERGIEARVLRALSAPLSEALPLFLEQAGAARRPAAPPAAAPPPPPAPTPPPPAPAGPAGRSHAAAPSAWRASAPMVAARSTSATRICASCHTRCAGQNDDRWHGSSGDRHVFSASGPSMAVPASSIVASTAGACSANPPPMPRWLVTSPADASCCITLPTKGAGAAMAAAMSACDNRAPGGCSARWISARMA